MESLPRDIEAALIGNWLGHQHYPHDVADRRVIHGVDVDAGHLPLEFAAEGAAAVDDAELVLAVDAEAHVGEVDLDRVMILGRPDLPHAHDLWCVLRRCPSNLLR